MAKMKKEKTAELKNETKNVKKKIVIVNNAPVVVEGKKFYPNDVIENIDENIMKRLVNEGIAEWQEN